LIKKKLHRMAAAARIDRSPALPHAVLRVSPEPYRYCTESQVHRLLTARPVEYVSFVRNGLRAIAHGRARLTLPPKQVFPDASTGGDFRVMPCELRYGGTTTKTVKVIGTNTLQRMVPDQITVGKLLVLDPAENYVSAIVEACLLSSARTGACAALALDALARKRDRLVVIGSGRVGLYTALYAGATGAKHVVLCDSALRRAAQAAQWLSRKLPRVKFQALAATAVSVADVVVIATTSETPVLSPPAWGANLVISLGADTDAQSELDTAWVRHADLYCDTPDSLRFGDLRAWVESGLVKANAVTDLLDTYRAPPPATKRPRVFISTGSALFDNLTARYLMSRSLR
jgi:ornithine cyclodeaminase/alanine dehydrogenase-like protein (mu-crystallin family)